MNQTTMIDEMALLIKNNLSSKHFVLSAEETLVDFLQNDTSLNGILAWEPTNAYNRHLLHRLAEIFGLSHESIGEGDKRHLIMERHSQSSIPSVLVRDMLWQYDQYEEPIISQQILRRTGTSGALKTDSPSPVSSLRAREASYQAARERIFSKDNVGTSESVRRKPKNAPDVALRMIAHALGQRISTESSREMATMQAERKKLEGQGTNLETTRINMRNLNIGSVSSSPKVSSCKTTYVSSSTPVEASQISRNIQAKPCVGISNSCGKNMFKEDNKQERVGAAKRLFANALGIQGAKENHGETKPTQEDQ